MVNMPSAATAAEVSVPVPFRSVRTTDSVIPAGRSRPRPVRVPVIVSPALFFASAGAVRAMVVGALATVTPSTVSSAGRWVMSPVNETV